MSTSTTQRYVPSPLPRWRFGGRLGLSQQKPLQRAYQRDPVAIERWREETFPAIAEQARNDNADFFFWDESGLIAHTQCRFEQLVMHDFPST